MTLVELLIYITAGGAAAFAAWLGERWPWFKALSSEVKPFVMFAISTALGLGAHAVVTYVPPEVLAQLEPWFKVVYTFAALFLVNQVAHKADPGRNADDKLLSRTEPPR